MADFGKINLTALESAIMELNGKNGKVECIVIPIEKNHLKKFKSEKTGKTYVELPWVGFKTNKLGDNVTHTIKLSVDKEVREAMSEDEQKKLPFIGTASIWTGGNGEDASNVAKPENGKDVFTENDDLPW